MIVAQALIALEKALGDMPLIEHPKIKILAGTSTGSLIAAGLAHGASNGAGQHNRWNNLAVEVIAWLRTGDPSTEYAL